MGKFRTACPTDDLSKFCRETVQSVKQNLFTVKELQVSLKRQDQSLMLNLSRKNLGAMARELYRYYGIEIRQVDSLESPQEIVITWHRDNPLLNPISDYCVKCLQNQILTDCALKMGDKLFTAHKIVLASKSPYFEKAFSGAFKEAKSSEIEVAIDGLCPQSVELLRGYLYKGHLELKGCSTALIESLLHLSDYFDLPYLQYLCLRHLCETVDFDNLTDYLKLAKYYEYDEFYTALLEHIKPKINTDNYGILLKIAPFEHLEELKTVFESNLIQQIRKVDYEPCGFGPSRRCGELGYYLNFAIEHKNQEIVKVCFKKMEEVCSHPGYGTHLEKLLCYLGVYCMYKPQLDWLGSANLNKVSKYGNNLYQETLNSIKNRSEEYMSKYFSIKLMTACWEIAKGLDIKILKQSDIDVMKQTILKTLLSKINTISDEVAIQEYFQMAKEYQLEEIKQACEEKMRQFHIDESKVIASTTQRICQ